MNKKSQKSDGSDCEKEVKDLRARLEALEKEYHKSQSFAEQLMMSLSNDIGMATDLLHGALTVIQEELDSPTPDWDMVRETLARIAPLGVERAVQLRKFLEGAVHLAFRSRPLNMTSVSLLELLQRVVAETKTRVDESGFSMIVDLPKKIPSLQADEDIIHRVIEVMLDNALKFTPGADSIRIELTSVNGMQQVGIMDSNTSLSADELKRRWEEGDKETPQWMKDVRLIFCERALEAHTGRFWVETIPEGWTAYRFSLPTGKH